MRDFMSIIYSNYTNITNMTLFNYLKTGNPVYDAIISTILISCLGYLINYTYENQLDKYIFKLSWDDIKCIIYRKNAVILEGKRSSVISGYSLAHNISSLYTDRFKAMVNYIINNIEKIDSIYKIKEIHSNFQSSDESENKKKNLDLYMVCQDKHFEIDNDIFVKIQLELEEHRDDKEKLNSKTDKITITIYSFKYSTNYLKNYIDDITEKHLQTIKNNRKNQNFIYKLDKVKLEDDESVYSCWREYLFESARTFNNMFFDGKQELLEKIDFFLENKDWYYKKGIPYTLGIGLHGPPGTGKTCLIKSLANYKGRHGNLLRRHVIFISLKMFKTKRQLDQFFFEKTYNTNNEKGSITFDKKIIVFEDIDCIGDIVLERKFKKNNKRNNYLQISKENVIQNICQMNDNNNNNNNNNNIVQLPCIDNEQPITLDDILNLWDGIIETPGRILIISSNHYDKLDSALIRPGRIDISLELRNVSHNVISELYFNFFETKIREKDLKKIKEYFYSPAEIVNIYLDNKTEDEFIKRLIQNKKL